MKVVKKSMVLKEGTSYKRIDSTTHEWFVGDNISGYSYSSDEAALSAVKKLMDIGVDEIVLQRASDLIENSKSIHSTSTGESIKEDTELAYEDEDDPVDMENEDEVRDAVAMYLSTLHIKPKDFENVVDNYVDLIMENGYSSMSDWWADFIENNEEENLKNMGYIL